MKLGTAATLSVLAHAAVCVLLPGGVAVAPQAPPPELVVWCTLAEEPASATAAAERRHAPVRELTEPEPVPTAASAAAVEPPPAALPAPVLTAAAAVPAPEFTAPAAVMPPVLPSRLATPAAAAPASPAAAGEAGGMVTVSQMHYRSAPPPEYPALAQRRGYEGTVRVQVEVDIRGRVTTASLVRSSGYDVLDAAALHAVRGWTFAPVTVDGMPRAARGIVPVRFALR